MAFDFRSPLYLSGADMNYWRYGVFIDSPGSTISLSAIGPGYLWCLLNTQLISGKIVTDNTINYIFGGGSYPQLISLGPTSGGYPTLPQN